MQRRHYVMLVGLGVALVALATLVVVVALDIGSQLAAGFGPGVSGPPAPLAEQRFESLFGWELPDGAMVIHESDLEFWDGTPRLQEFVVLLPADFKVSEFETESIEWQTVTAGEATIRSLGSIVDLSSAGAPVRKYLGSTSSSTGDVSVDVIEFTLRSYLRAEYFHTGP